MRCLLFLLFCLLLSATGFTQEVILFEDDFDGGSLLPAWRPEPNLVGQNGVVDVVGNAGNGGTPGVRLGKNLNSDFTVNALDLSLDLSDQDQVELRFQIFDLTDANDPEDGIYLSDDGGDSFTKIFDFSPEFNCDYRYGTFPPLDLDELATRFGRALNDQSVVRFQQAGFRSFTGDGQGNPDGLYLDNVVVAVPDPTFADLPFSDNFDNNFLDPAWRWSFPENTVQFNLPNPAFTSDNGVFLNPTAGPDGSPAVLLGRGCNGPLSVSALDLRLDLEGKTQVEMGFDVADYNDRNHVDDILLFSDDGGNTFVRVLRLYPEEWCDFVFGAFPVIDVDELAAAAGLELTDRFVVRFQHMDNRSFSGDGQGDPAGLVIDNVFVREESVVFADLPFTDDFDDLLLDEAWAFRDPSNTVFINAASNPSSPSNFVGVGSTDGLNGSPGVFLGRRCNGPLTTNALDLRLNLAGEEQVELSFWIRDFNDRNHVDDGLYGSDDGGVTFAKMLAFSPEEWCDFTWGFYPLDLDSLASAAGLELTDEFVVRFQQTGTRSFTGDGQGDPDGFTIDDVAVFDPEVVYAQPPFFDDFNNNFAATAWKRAYAGPTTQQAVSNDLFTPMNWSGVDPVCGINGTSGLFMGRRCNGPYTVNAYDLHLDLANRFNVLLDFFVLDNFDETDPDDGLYFSNDNGVTWVKAVNFDPGNWVDQSWFAFPTVDVVARADSLGLMLTDRFIVRFQQAGTRSFTGDGQGNPDGLYFDDVRVSASPTATTAPEPNGGTLSVWPNPGLGQLNLLLSSPGKHTITLYSSVGQRVFTRSLTAGQGSMHTLDLQHLSAGIYHLVDRAPDNTTQTKKIVLK
jgi:hypothetical protein